MVLAIMSLLLTTQPIESNEALHATAHVGGSYVVTQAVAVGSEKLLGTSKTTSQIIGSAIALSAGVAKEYLDRRNGESLGRNALGLSEDATGILGAVFVLNMKF